MSDKREKPKTRTGSGLTKAGRNSRTGGVLKGKNGDRAHTVYAGTSDRSGTLNVGETRRTVTQAAQAKATMKASCQHASELLRAYGNEKLGEQSRWNRPTAHKAVCYLNYLFFGKPEDAAQAASLDEDIKSQIRTHFVHYCEEKTLTGTFGQGTAWYAGTEAMPLSRLEDPANMDPSSLKAKNIASREAQVELARELIIADGLYGVPKQAAEIFFELFPYVVVPADGMSRSRMTNELVRERLGEVARTRSKAVDKGLICAHKTTQQAFAQLKSTATNS